MQESSDVLYGEVVAAVLRIQPLLDVVKQDAPRSLPDLADKLFALRECSKRLDELRKAVDRVEETQEKMFIAVYLASSKSSEKVKTDFVTAEAIPKLGLRVPRKHEEVYGKLMSFLGVPSEVIEHGVCEVHFPGWCSYYTALQARGEDVPAEIKDSLAEYDMCYVKTIKRKGMKIDV